MEIKSNPHAIQGFVEVDGSCGEYSFPNLLVDQGYEPLFTYPLSYGINQLRFGTGNTTPAAGNTGLVSEISGVAIFPTTTTAVIDSGNPAIIKVEKIFDYTNATFSFRSIREFGIWSQSLSMMAVRTLPKDGSNNPTTIGVGFRGYLKVKHTMNITRTNNDTSGSFTYNSVLYNWRFVDGFVRPLAGADLSLGIYRIGVDAISNVPMFGLSAANIQANLDAIYIAGMGSQNHFVFTDSILTGVGAGSYIADRVGSNQFSRSPIRTVRVGCTIPPAVGDYPTGIATMFCGMESAGSFKHRSGALMFNPPLPKPTATTEFNFNDLIRSTLT